MALDVVLSKELGKFQMPEKGKESIFDLLCHHQRLKNSQAYKRGKILIFKFRVWN
jgi:hypothetical protein